MDTARLRQLAAAATEGADTIDSMVGLLADREATIADLRAQLAAAQQPQRPTGAGYVRYEDLYRPGDTLRAVLAKVTGRQVLTFPEDVFEFSNFNDPRGWYEGVRIPQNCGGLWGSGRGTVLRMTANTSTVGGDTRAVPTKDWTTNQTGLLGVWYSDTVLRNFQLQGTEQGHPYNGLRIAGKPGAHLAGIVIDGVYFNGAGPGYSGFPPGETFQLGINRADGVRLLNSEFDGRKPGTDETWCASPFGWNNGRDAYVENVHTHHSGHGTATFWQTTGIHTVNLRVDHNGGLAAINHENVGGRVLHERPTLIIDRAGTGRPSQHISLLNGSFGDNPDVTIVDPVHDAGVDGGTLSVNMADRWTDPITHGPMTQKTLPTVIKGGVRLEGRDSRTSGYKIGLDPAKHFVRYH